jgi:hypothetical protein
MSVRGLQRLAQPLQSERSANGVLMAVPILALGRQPSDCRLRSPQRSRKR